MIKHDYKWSYAWCKVSICYFSLWYLGFCTSISVKSGAQVVSPTRFACTLVRHSPLSTCSRMMSSLGFKANKSLIWEIRAGFGLSASKGSRTIRLSVNTQLRRGFPQLFHKLVSSSLSAKQLSSWRIPPCESVISQLNWPDLRENRDQRSFVWYGEGLLLFPSLIAMLQPHIQLHRSPRTCSSLL